MNLKNRMTPDEYNKLDEDIKYDCYADLYDSCKKLISQNDNQYRLLDLKDKKIQKLKDIVISIIEIITE